MNVFPQSAIDSIKRLRYPLFAGDWDELAESFSHTSITVKGVSISAQALARVIASRRLLQVQVVVEEMLSRIVQSHRIDCRIRVAIIGRKASNMAKDGIISDVRLVLLRSGEAWSVIRLDADCPPDWAQWENRPNEFSTIDYCQEELCSEQYLKTLGIEDGCPVKLFIAD